jgi:RNA polymerase sigma-70 factor (ECF subfamily)
LNQKQKGGTTSETVQNKTIDNLQADIDFNGDANSVSKAIATLPENSSSF